MTASVSDRHVKEGHWHLRQFLLKIICSCGCHLNPAVPQSVFYTDNDDLSDISAWRWRRYRPYALLHNLEMFFKALLVHLWLFKLFWQHMLLYIPSSEAALHTSVKINLFVFMKSRLSMLSCIYLIKNSKALLQFKRKFKMLFECVFKCSLLLWCKVEFSASTVWGK